MEIIKKDTGELQGTLVVKITENDYKERVDNELKKMRKKVNLKGFRPGHVPMSVVKKMFGKDIIAQEVTTLVDQELKKYLEENKIDLVGDFIPAKDEETKFDIENDTEYQFAFDFGYFPEFDINLDDITVPYYSIKIEDKTIDDEIENLRNKYGEFVEAEKADEKSKITATFTELDENDKPKENGLTKQDAFFLIETLDDEAKKLFIGKQKDDKIIIELKKVFKNDTDLASMLNIEKEKINELAPKFELTITKIENYKPADLDQKFFDLLFGADKVHNEEELRQEIKKIIEEQYKTESKIRFHYDLRKILKEKIDFQLPDEFIVRWQARTRKQDEEQVRKELDELKKAVKWDRIISKLADLYSIKVEQKDLIDANKANIINYLQQMGLSTSMFTDEQLEQFAADELDKMKDNDKYYLIYATLERKVLDALFEKVNKEEKEITFDKLKKLYEDEQKELQQQNKTEDNKEEKNTESEK